MSRSSRSPLKSFVMMGILGIALIALVVTGFGTGGMGGLTPGASAEELARVEGDRVIEPEVADLVNRQFRQAQQQQPGLDMATFLDAGAFDEVLRQVIAGRALTSFGRDQGLAVTDRMIDQVIVQIPAFRNFAGQFDDAAFREILRRENITEQQLRRDIADQLMQRQMLAPIGGAATAPQGVALQLASARLEQRRGSIGIVPSGAFAEGIAPTDEEVANHYRQNQARYTVPERRVVRYAMIGREQVANQTRATDQEIEAFYRENAATYGGSETRNLSHVVLRDEAAARAFAARLREGMSFQQAAQQAGFSAADIAFPNQTRQAFANVTSPAVADAAFSAAQGAVAGPIRSELGFHVVRVDALNQTGARPLAAVREEIREQVEQRKLQDALAGLVGRVEDRLAEGANFTEVARAEGLSIQETPPITAGGQAPGTAFQLPPELQPLLGEVFQLGQDDDYAVLTVEQNERFAAVTVARVLPAAPPPLQEIQAEVREDLIRRRASERARAVAQNIIERINGGAAPAAAFAAAGARLPPPQPVEARRIELIEAGGQVPAPIALMFAIPQGNARLLEAPNGAGWFVVHLAERIPGNAADNQAAIQAARRELNQSAGQELTEQFVRAVQARADVRRNDAAIERARQRLRGNAPVQ
ncbi:MAG: SurA N-terminal domain-containing protein [Allosphingosinicella sp.]|uniref:peptidylprolyl isomerase n=1 Tax=Allosphingosinicella sp. TaxID=2823234 RepID=UPI00391FDC28